MARVGGGGGEGGGGVGAALVRHATRTTPAVITDALDVPENGVGERGGGNGTENGVLVLADDGFIYVQAASVPALHVTRVSPKRKRLRRKRCIGSGVVENRTLLFTAFHLAS